MKTNLTRKHVFKLSLLLAAALPASLQAQSTTLTQAAAANTFVSSDMASMNFGTLGAMEIAGPTAAQATTQEILLLFNTAALQAGFNSAFGAGNWVVTGVTLEFFSNFNTAGTQPNNSIFNVIDPGGFELDWLNNTSWSQTAITWNNISSVLPGTGGNTSAVLGDFNYLANGAGSSTWSLTLDPNLVNSIDTGAPFSVFGQPTANSTVGLLVDAIKQGSPVVLSVTASEVPEPGTMMLAVTGLAGLAALRRGKA